MGRVDGEMMALIRRLAHSPLQHAADDGYADGGASSADAGGWGNADAGGWGGGNSNYSVTCSSNNNRSQTCDWDERQGRPVLQQQLSGSACQEGRSWGYSRGQVWVSNGCRARFGTR